jgi:hypothetical protein
VAEWAIETKHKVIRAAEDKIAHFDQLIIERPKYRRLWEYWRSWYVVRRDDWLSMAWLEQVREWKRRLRAWEREGTITKHLQEAERIGKNVDAIEDGLSVIETELKQVLDMARERNWRIRYPKPQTTMEGWIGSIHDRYPIIKQWIHRIREELPRAWIDFVYVIYYAYTSPGAERHLEAHLESKCQNPKEVKTKVKELANKILRAFVAAPRVVAGEIKPGYDSPLLRADMANPPYEGKIIQGQNMWQWGVQWNAEINYMVAEKRVAPSESTGEIAAPRSVPIRLEIFDYDYAQLRSYKEAELPALWWQLTLEQLLELLEIEVER